MLGFGPSPALQPCDRGDAEEGTLGQAQEPAGLEQISGLRESPPLGWYCPDPLPCQSQGGGRNVVPLHPQGMGASGEGDLTTKGTRVQTWCGEGSLARNG